MGKKSKDLVMKDSEYKKLIEPYKEKAIEALAGLIKIDSTYDEESSCMKMPFGKGVTDALDYVASLGEKLGFRVDRCNNYVTELSYGRGNKILDIYAHCDVVEVNREHWTKEPFALTIEDNNIYGRGACDDKGSLIACLYAVKALIDDKRINGHTLRFIVGGNEERGSRCLEHYFHTLKKTYPTMGFTPDADFPMIYAEKSIARIQQVYQLSIKGVDSFSAGDALNIVCDNCKAVIKSDYKKLSKAVKEYSSSYRDLKGEVKEDGTVTFIGKPAHGSIPYKGVNAALHMLNFIGEYFDVELLKFIFECYYDGRGKKMGLCFKDKVFKESTYNVGKVIYTGNELKIFVDARFPSTVEAEEVSRKLRKITQTQTNILSTSAGYVFDKNAPLVSLLMQAYREETGDSEAEPLAIGGGTYARESKNSVAFGPTFVGRDYRIHGDDEFLPLEDFYASMQIYASAIDKLSSYLKGEGSETASQKMDK